MEGRRKFKFSIVSSWHGWLATPLWNHEFTGQDRIKTDERMSTLIFKLGENNARKKYNTLGT